MACHNAGATIPITGDVTLTATYIREQFAVLTTFALGDGSCALCPWHSGADGDSGHYSWRVKSKSAFPAPDGPWTPTWYDYGATCTLLSFYDTVAGATGIPDDLSGYGNDAPPYAIDGARVAPLLGNPTTATVQITDPSGNVYSGVVAWNGSYFQGDVPVSYICAADFVVETTPGTTGAPFNESLCETPPATSCPITLYAGDTTTRWGGAGGYAMHRYTVGTTQEMSCDGCFTREKTFVDNGCSGFTQTSVETTPWYIVSSSSSVTVN